ncbi:hypothetical protein MKW92_025982 [Papaver armeniacum]|nr:hypothetical protein MKW92_025982 [Papaver armeniacum]
MKRKKKPNFNKPINQSPSMVSPTSSSSIRFKRKTLVILSSFLISVIVILYLTSNINQKRKFVGDDFVPLTDEFHSIEVVNEFPHDPKAFTQGLLYGGDDFLYESTGLYKQSSVRKVDIKTGKVEILQKMGATHFGEGLTLLDDRLIQVIWLEPAGFIYDRHNLSQIGKFTHGMKDGWGLATDGKVLFGTDGSSSLYHLDPKTFKVLRSDVVRYKGYEVHNLNELEYVNGEVWANIWMSDCIARISQKDGVVLGWIILPELRKRLLKAGNRRIDVLNGIAWDSEKNRLFVTGKLWPKLYEIKLHPMKEGLQAGDVATRCLRRYEFH